MTEWEPVLKKIFKIFYFCFLSTTINATEQNFFSIKFKLSSSNYFHRFKFRDLKCNFRWFSHSLPLILKTFFVEFAKLFNIIIFPTINLIKCSICSKYIKYSFRWAIFQLKYFVLFHKLQKILLWISSEYFANLWNIRYFLIHSLNIIHLLFFH